MPFRVKIPYSSAEYQVRFARPIIKLIADRALAVQQVVDALLPFGFLLKNAETLSPNNPAEQKIIFRLPERTSSFQFGAEGFIFNKENANWTTASDDINVIEASERALLEGTKVEILTRTLTLAMHLQLLDGTREQVLDKFLPEPFREASEGQSVKSHGAQVTWQHGSMLVDYSAVVANGVFLRVANDFEASKTIRDMATHMYSGEKFAFQMLGVEEASNNE